MPAETDCAGTVAGSTTAAHNSVPYPPEVFRLNLLWNLWVGAWSFGGRRIIPDARGVRWSAKPDLLKGCVLFVLFSRVLLGELFSLFVG